MSDTPRTLQGKNAIVTGASRGIGVAISENLASKGANVILNFTSPSSKQPTEDLAATLSKKYNIKAFPVQASLGEADSGRLIVEAAVQHLGDKGKVQIDIIVNNAGVSDNKLLQDIDIAHFETQYKVNVLGPLLLVQAAIPYLPFDRSGRIVNVSSVSASIGFAAQTVYGGTKAALESMTRTWARELAGRATVNAVNPGPVDTEMFASAVRDSKEVQGAIHAWVSHTPLAQETGEQWTAEQREFNAKLGGRMGAPAEIAGIVGMLVGAESAWCTGSTICANGGFVFTN